MFHNGNTQHLPARQCVCGFLFAAAFLFYALDMMCAKTQMARGARSQIHTILVKKLEIAQGDQIRLFFRSKENHESSLMRILGRQETEVNPRGILLDPPPGGEYPGG